MIAPIIIPASQVLEEWKRIGIQRIEGPWRPEYVCPHRAWCVSHGQYWKTWELPKRPAYDRKRWNCVETAEDFENEIKKQIISTEIEAPICVGKVEMQLSVSGNVFGIEIDADDRNHVAPLVRLAEGPWAWWNQYDGGLVDLPDDLGDIGIVAILFGGV